MLVNKVDRNIGDLFLGRGRRIEASGGVGGHAIGSALRRIALSSCIGGLAGLVPVSAMAFSLGEPQVTSTFGQPLSVRVPVSLNDANEEAHTADMAARIVPASDYAAQGAEAPASLDQMNVRVVTEGDAMWLELSSTVPIREPMISVIVEARLRGATIRREVPVLFDLQTASPAGARAVADESQAVFGPLPPARAPLAAATVAAAVPGHTPQRAHRHRPESQPQSYTERRTTGPVSAPVRISGFHLTESFASFDLLAAAGSAPAPAGVAQAQVAAPPPAAALLPPAQTAVTAAPVAASAPAASQASVQAPAPAAPQTSGAALIPPGAAPPASQVATTATTPVLPRNTQTPAAPQPSRAPQQPGLFDRLLQFWWLLALLAAAPFIWWNFRPRERKPYYGSPLRAEIIPVQVEPASFGTGLGAFQRPTPRPALQATISEPVLVQPPTDPLVKQLALMRAQAQSESAQRRLNLAEAGLELGLRDQAQNLLNEIKRELETEGSKMRPA
jgi:hypothetical protein